jgi:hypothetical protein
MVVNRGTIRRTTNFVYNRESAISLKWNTTCIDILDYSKNRSYCSTSSSTPDFKLIGLETTSNLVFLTCFDPKFWDGIQNMSGVMLTEYLLTIIVS